MSKDRSRSGSSKSHKRFFKKRKEETRITYLGNYVPDNLMKRGGCIMYTATPEGFKFCFGIDSVHLELTDFGGSFDTNKDKNIIDTAFREFKEESLGLIDLDPKQEELKIASAVYNHKDLIVFIPVSLDTEAFTNKFNEAIELARKAEMQTCKWITKDEMIKHYKDGKMYKKVAKLLSKLGDTLFETLK